MITLTKSRLESLIALNASPYWVTSLYLSLSPGMRNGGQYLIHYKTMAKEARERVKGRDLPPEVRDSLLADLDRMETFLSAPQNLKGMRGVALFSVSGRDVFEVFSLPRVYRNRLVQDATPFVRQLRALVEAFRPTVVALVDRNSARLFRLGLERIHEIADYFYPGSAMPKFHEDEGPASRGRQMGSSRLPAHGYGEHGYHRKIELHLHKHYQHVARKLFEHLQDTHFERLIIGGPKGEIEAFQEYLHSYLRERLVGVIHLDVHHTPPAELQEKVQEILEEAELQEEVRLVREWEENLGNGLAVEGVEATLQALNLGQVRIFFLNDQYAHPGYRCPEGYLGLEEKDLEGFCPGEVVPVEDLADDALELALQIGAEVQVLRSPEARERIPTMAATLRYRL
ncbi:MAG: host attachment protein [Candidatus Hydrothermae bacterium]|nr:host attachment protein [Candidatus Hydrothermae bacterium]